MLFSFACFCVCVFCYLDNVWLFDLKCLLLLVDFLVCDFCFDCIWLRVLDLLV